MINACGINVGNKRIDVTIEQEKQTLALVTTFPKANVKLLTRG